MRSLKLEAKILAKEMDCWLGSPKTTTLRSRTRTQATSTASRKRRRRSNIDDDDRRQKRRLFYLDDDDDDDEEVRSNSERSMTEEEDDDSDVEIISSFSEKTKSTNQGFQTELDDDDADDEGVNCVCPTDSTESDLVVDKEYMAYLQYIIETYKGNFDAMSNEGNVDCCKAVHNNIVEDKGSHKEVLNEGFNGNVDANTTDDDNVDFERVLKNRVDVMEDKCSSEQFLYVDMNGIVYEKITDDDNVGCENPRHSVCVYEGVSPEQLDVDDKCEMEYLEFVNTNVDSDPKSSGENLDASLDMLPENVGCGSQGSAEDDVDPDYKIFLDNVKEDEYSYVFERKKEDGTTVLVRYEEDNGNLIEDTTKDERSHLEYSSSQERMKDLEDKLKSQTKVLDNDFGKTNPSPAEQPRCMTPHWFLSGCKPGTISCTDESYLKFLDHVWVEGDSLTFKYEGVIVKYGDDNRVVADPEILQQKDAAYGNEMKFTQYTDLKTSKVAMSEDDSDSVQILDSGKGHHKKEFTKLLRKEISKPYDKYELKVSQKNAKVRKWIELDKETRGTSFSVPTKRKRKSYLGHYPDLKRLLNGALEEPFPQERALALLRCLFFHVKHRPHPGYFVPWRYPPTWLHDRICCCQGNSRNCPIKNRRRSKNRVLNLD